MAGPIIADRIQETSITVGTLPYALLGATTGFRSFGSALANGDTVVYLATDTSGNWEIGVGTYATSGTTLTRTSIRQSSNANAAVSWAAGTKTISQIEDAAYFGGLAPLASPTFTGTPAAPTAVVGTNTTQLATTAFVLANAAALTLLGSLTTSSYGASLTGLPTSYRLWYLEFAGPVVTSSGSIVLSSTNGSAWGSGGPNFPAGTLYGWMIISGVGNSIAAGKAGNAWTGAMTTAPTNTAAPANGLAINANCTGGTINVYGMK